MNSLIILAAAHQKSSDALGISLPAQTDMIERCKQLGPAETMLLIVGGVVYLLWGFKIYRALITLNAGLVGAYAGMMLGAKAGSSAAGFIVGGLLAGVIAWPMMKYSVAAMGGLFGGVVGAAVWRNCNLDPSYYWAGALIGLIFFGMLSFILFRISIMMYTSLQGAIMLIFGVLAMSCKYREIEPQITKNMMGTPYLLPTAILVAAVIGIIYQQARGPVGAGASTSGNSESKK